MTGVENSTSGTVYGHVVQAGHIDGDVVFNQLVYAPPTGHAEVRIVSRQKPGFWDISLKKRYRLTFTVTRDQQGTRTHTIDVIHGEFKVSYQVDGFEVFTRTFSAIHSHKTQQAYDSRIQDVPIRFETWQTTLRGRRVCRIFIGDYLAWNLTHGG